MIRLAELSDWNSISDISKRSGYIDYINRIGPAFLEDGEVLVYEDESILAFTKLRYLTDNAAWFSGLRVDPEHWRKGIGTVLTKSTIERAREEGCNLFRTLVFDDNFRSLKLFDKLGAVKVQKYHFYQGIPDLSGYKKNSRKYSGYINRNWEFTRYSEDDPIEFETFTKDGWEFIMPDERTVQIVKIGSDRLELSDKEGSTCLEGMGGGEKYIMIAQENSGSTGFLLEIPL